MTVWFYATEGNQEGPITEKEIRNLIRSRKIAKDTYVWREGMDGWEPAGSHRSLLDAFIAPPPLPPDQRVVISSTEVSSANQSELASPRPWRRFWARMIDNLLLAPIIALALAMWSASYAPKFFLEIATMNTVLFGILLMPVIGLVLAFSMIVTGTTVGKVIAGVNVPVPSGASRVRFFIARELKVWAGGCGLGIPLVALFTQIHQYRRVRDGKPAGYDEGNPAVAVSNSGVRLVFTFVVALPLLAGNVALRGMSQEFEVNLNATEKWVNPITSESADIRKIWQARELEIRYGRAFYFSAPELLSEAVFGHERSSTSKGYDLSSYADALKSALASEVSINTSWEPVTVDGAPGLRARGNALKDDSSFEVTIIARGSDMWRVLVFFRGNSTRQMEEKVKLVDSLLKTTR